MSIQSKYYIYDKLKIMFSLIHLIKTVKHGREKEKRTWQHIKCPSICRDEDNETFELMFPYESLTPSLERKDIWYLTSASPNTNKHLCSVRHDVMMSDKLLLLSLSTCILLFFFFLRAEKATWVPPELKMISNSKSAREMRLIPNQRPALRLLLR